MDHPRTTPLNSPAATGHRTNKLHAPAASGQVQALDSRAILQGQGSVAIVHKGIVYRLQATRLGKLILTK